MTWWRRWGLLVVLAFIGGWIAAIFVGANVWPGGERGGRYLGAGYAAAVFGTSFSWGIVAARRAQLRAGGALYDRLALTQVPPAVLRAAAGGFYRTVIVFQVGGLVVTVIGLGAMALPAGSAWAGRLLYLILAVVGAWLVATPFLLRLAVQSGDAVLSPLGLALGELPAYHTSLLHDITTVTGVASYVGRRHGRDVAVLIGMKDTNVAVAGRTAQEAATPRTPHEMAALTGVPAKTWLGVVVRIDAGGVVVHRDGAGVGPSILHDLLLAEAIAGQPD